MRIMFVGDINLGEYYTSFGHGPRTFAATRDVFEKVKPIFAQADCVVGNLEAPITERVNHASAHEAAVLRGNPRHAHQLREAGFKVLQVANNHTVQHGDSGFDDTVALLHELDIKPVGLCGEEPVRIIAAGTEIAFLAASDVPDNTDVNQQKYQRLDDAFVEYACAVAGTCDHLVVMLHWGLEASTSPLANQRKLVDKLQENGVSAVIGSHPHLFYEVERRKHFVAAYSLGNFVFDLCWDDRMIKTGILDLEFSKSDIKARMWPVEIRENGCLPTPAGEPVDIEDTVVPYDLGTSMDRQQLRKLAYFARNLHKGNTTLKARFLARKLRPARRVSTRTSVD